MRMLAVCLLLAACVPLPTVHEYCVQNAPRYRDYDQCYREESASRAEDDARRRGREKKQASVCTSRERAAGVIETTCTEK